MVVAVERNMTSSLERTLFQTLGAFSGVFATSSITEFVWEKYQAFAIPRLEEATYQLKKELPFIAECTPDIAVRDLEFLKAISAPIMGFQQKIESITDADFERFRKAALAFFNILLELKSELKKASEQNDNVRASFHYMTRTRKNPAFAKYLRDAKST